MHVNRRRTKSTVLMRCAALGMLLAVAVAAGCNIVTPAAFAVMGPPGIDKVTELEKRTTVIFIDDRDSKLPRRSLRGTIGKVAETYILKEKLLTAEQLISTQSALRIATADNAAAPLSAVDIGRRVGAEVVIFVEMEGWTLSRGGAEISPAAGATVKILDCVTNQRIWPDNPEGYPLKVQMPRQPSELHSTRADRNKLEEQLATQIGYDLAGMFYDHARTPLQDQRVN